MGTLLAILFIALFGILWAAPSYTTRQTPAGIMLDEGGTGAKITFAADPDVSIWEMEVEPPGQSVDMIEQTTQFNTEWETFAFAVLKKFEESSVKCGYDPNFESNITSLIGVNTEITIRWPDGSRLAFWGGLRAAKFSRLVKGQLPTVDITVHPTMRDNSGAEQDYVYSNVAGT